MSLLGEELVFIITMKLNTDLSVYDSQEVTESTYLKGKKLESYNYQLPSLVFVLLGLYSNSVNEKEERRKGIRKMRHFVIGYQIYSTSWNLYLALSKESRTCKLNRS